MINKAICFLIAGVLILHVPGWAQTSPGTSPGLKTVVAPSPNASSLGKYGEIPVGMYTGIPNISIPLYTLKGRELELPIGLNYHAGGVRVEEIASLVGIGWSLNAGGVITRTIRGAPDDASGGYFSSYAARNTLAKKYMSTGSLASLQVGVGNVVQADVNDVESIRQSVLDAEPDIYYFNFGKYSGSFFMNESGQLVVSPLQALNIQYSFNQSNTIKQWILKTPDGTKYVFGTSLDGSRSAMESNSNGAPWPVATTGWYLEDIYSPHNDTISFAYTNISYSYVSRSSEVLNWGINGTSVLPFKDNRISTNNMIVPRLASITSANGTISFIAGSNRLDLPGEAPLAQVNIYNKTSGGTLLKQWQFGYDYSTTRLTLNSLKEYSGDGTLQGQGYAFAYNILGPLPNPDPNGTALNSQDLWGYYNGVPNAVLPQGFTTPTPFGTATITGADRHSDATEMQVGTLTQITYPTGGSSQFDFEPNTVYQAAGDLSIPPAGVSRDGLRTFTPEQTVDTIFTITYPDPYSNVAVLSGQIHTMNISGNSCTYDPTGFSQCYSAWIVGVNGTTYGPTYFKEGPISVTLPAGTYEMVGQGSGDPKVSGNLIHYELSWMEFPPPSQSPLQLVNKVIGGLRVKRITNYDGINTSVTKYLYNNFSDTSSSGVLVNEPYNYVNIFESVASGQPTVDYLQVKSYPVVPLMPTQGAAIGYQHVTKMEGENGENGKEEYTYTTANDYPDQVQDYRPYPASGGFDWRRGQLLKTTTYKNSAGTFVPIMVKSNGYANSIKQTTGYGIAVDCDLSQTGGLLVSPTNYYAAGYRTISEYQYLQADTTLLYDQNNLAAYQQTINNYAYDTVQGHYQLTKSVTTDSKNHVVETDYSYPQDVTLSGYEETARQNLISNFILSPVLETKVLRNGTQIRDTKNNYKVFGNGFALPESIDVQTSTFPIDRRVEFLRYDNYGNLKQQHKMNDVLNTYIWDYNQEYPIASVLGADSVDIAYTSFEADGGGTWTIPSALRDTGSATGSACYSLTHGAITRSGLTAATSYVVSYWSKSGSYSVSGSTATLQGKTIAGWTYYEHTVTGITSLTVSGSADIDELRLYPQAAQMTSYTYTPLIGVTSQCDVDSRITYYHYDLLGRLSYLQDQDRNIIKTYQYHYKGQ